MRKPSSSLSSTVGELATSLLLTLSCLLPGAGAVTFTPASPASLDFTELGRVALAGDFDSVSLYQYVGQNENVFNGTQSLLSQYPNGVFATLQSTDGYIRAMCPYTNDGQLQGIVVGGNFTSLGGVEAGGIAMVNPNTTEVTPMRGVQGKIAALYCDQESGTVYVGGSFFGGSLLGSNSSNAITWAGQWLSLPFAGFNGPVNSITKSPDGHIVFGGEFDGLGNTTSPKVKDAQVVPLSSATITAGSSSTLGGFSDPKNIICKTGQDGPGNTWLLQDDSPGYWQATFQFGFQPTKLRLYNTRQDGRGTKTWRFTALPINGILRFSYIDATSGRNLTCDAECPLPSNNATYQDFHFVDEFIGQNGFRIEVLEWYGQGGGLSGIELFQDDIYSFAINEFNEPQCDNVSSTAASSTVTGAWSVKPSQSSSSEYLSVSLTGYPIDPAAASVVFRPNIEQSGNYSVTVFTPGCTNDGTCGTRGRVNITGSMAPTGSQPAPQPVSAELYQTNLYDKYDQVYLGYIDVSDDAFSPSITLAPSSQQYGAFTFVAQRVRFELLSQTTGGLNGLFEFDPSATVVDTDFSKSAIDVAGTDLRSPASVNELVTAGDTMFVGGQFSSRNYSNIFSITNNETSSLQGGGLDSDVFAMFVNGSELYVGGNFTNTRDNTTEGLSNVAVYSIDADSWSPLGAGVNGPVFYIVPFSLNITADTPETVISVNGFFDRVNAFGSNGSFAVENIAIWVPSRKNWLNNLGIPALSIIGELTACVDVPGSGSLFAGAVSSQALTASGAVGLTSTSRLALQQLPIKIQPRRLTTPLPLQRRQASSANATSQDPSGVVTGLMYTDNGLNLTVLAGHFNATSSDGSSVQNLLLIDGAKSDQVLGLPEGISSNSTFLALGTQGTTLFAGGAVTGQISKNDVNGLILYDLSGKKFVSNQPAALAGSSVVVSAIAPQPSSQVVFVGGTFQGAGSFSCPNLCTFDLDKFQWNSPGLGFTGTVSTLRWMSSTELLVGGDLTVGTNSTKLVTYNSKSRNYEAFPGASAIPGPISALCAGNSEGSQVWVAGTAANGTAFVEKYDGSRWISIGNLLGSGTTVRGLQVFPLSDDHDDADLLDKSEALVILGSLNIPNFGNASAAVYNGSSLTPFILTNTGDNQPGSLSEAFVQNPQNFFKKSHHNLAIGFVVLIGLAIALALTFLLVVIGILAERIRRRREGYIPAPTGMLDRNTQMTRIPPEHLFGSISPAGGRAGPPL